MKVILALATLLLSQQINAADPVCYSKVKSVKYTRDVTTDDLRIKEIQILNGNSNVVPGRVTVTSNFATNMNVVADGVTSDNQVWNPPPPTAVQPAPTYIKLAFSSPVTATSVRVNFDGLPGAGRNLQLYYNNLACGGTPGHGRIRMTRLNNTNTFVWNFGMSHILNTFTIVRETVQHIAAVQLYGFPVGSAATITNRATTALGAVATASTQLSGAYAPSFVLDSGDFSIWHSTDQDINPFLNVALPVENSLSRMVIVSRRDCCGGRILDGEVEAFDAAGTSVGVYPLLDNANFNPIGYSGCAADMNAEFEVTGSWVFDLTVPCPSSSPSITPSTARTVTPSRSRSPTTSVSPSPSTTTTITPTRSVSPTRSITPSTSVTPSSSSSASPSVSTSTSPSVSTSVSASASVSSSVTNSVTVTVTPSVTPSSTTTHTAPPTALPMCFPTTKARYIRYIRDNRDVVFQVDELQAWYGSTNMARSVKGVKVTANNVQGGDLIQYGPENVIDGSLTRPTSPVRVWQPSTDVRRSATLTMTFPQAVTLDSIVLVPRYSKGASINPDGRSFEIVINEQTCQPDLARTHLSSANSSAAYSWRLARPIRVKTITLRRTPAINLAGLQAWGPVDISSATYVNLATPAYGARAFASSVFVDPRDITIDYTAKNLMDVSMRTMWHSSFTDPEPVATIDLGREMFLTNVKAISRQDCCPGRALGGSIQLLDAQRLVIWSRKLTKGSMLVTGKADGCPIAQYEESTGEWGFSLPLRCVSRSATPTTTVTVSPSASPSESLGPI